MYLMYLPFLSRYLLLTQSKMVIKESRRGFWLALIFIASLVDCHPPDGPAPADRIVGGQPAALGEFPFIGTLIYRLWHNCTVTILNEEWVLTAAQCIWGNSPYSYQIRVGSVEWDRGGTLHTIAAGEHHENYVHDQFHHNDIAVIKVKPPFVFSDLVQPVQLAPPASEVPGGSRGRVAGWGEDGVEGESRLLLKTDLQTFTDAECREEYAEGTVETQICAGIKDGGAGICEGDPGSPLLVGGVQVGVASWPGAPCGATPGVWAQVSYFRDWIAARTGV